MEQGLVSFNEIVRKMIRRSHSLHGSNSSLKGTRYKVLHRTSPSQKVAEYGTCSVAFGTAQNPRKAIPRAVRLTFYRFHLRCNIRVLLFGMTSLLIYNSPELLSVSNVASTRVVANTSPPIIAALLHGVMQIMLEENRIHTWTGWSGVSLGACKRVRPIGTYFKGCLKSSTLPESQAGFHVSGSLQNLPGRNDSPKTSPRPGL